MTSNAKLLLFALFLIAPASFAQHQSVAGKWTTVIDTFDAPSSWPLTLEQTGDRVSGKLGGSTLEGTFKSGKLQFHATGPGASYEDLSATVVGDTMTGSVTWAQNGSVDHPTTHKFTAKRSVPSSPFTEAPRTHEFVPTVFHRQFSGVYEPVLTINPGDTIHTWTLDAGGLDSTGTPRSFGGNPQTGPFYINGAAPGDVLAIHIRKLKLNRDFALSTNGIVDRANPPGIASRYGTKTEDVRWHIDLEKGLASPEKPSPGLQKYSVPVRPMLGGIGVAPGDRNVPGIRAGDSGNFGGNLDFNEITEGATVYLPVRTDGALLYFGDGHAAQGDGEITGDALETSMDVTVTVDVLHDMPIRGPFVENGTHMIALGIDGSLDSALQDATERMENYLARKYKLSLKDFAMVLGSAAEYKVVEVADRNAIVALKLSKKELAGLTPATDK